MATDVIASKIKTFPSAPGVRERQTGYGQNGYQGSSSLLPGEKVDRSPIMQGIAEPDPDAKAADGWQQRKISAAPITTTPGMKNPNKSPAKIPDALNRGTIAPSVVPAKRGNAKR